MTTVLEPQSVSAGRSRVRVAWEFATGVQQVVLIARIGGAPAAIIDLCPGAGFRLSTCNGTELGSYLSLDEAQAAYEEFLDD